MRLYIKHFFEKLILPVSRNEDQARREFILNILLTAIIALSFVAFVINLLEWFRGVDNPISASVIFLILSFFIFLLFLSHRGFLLIVSTFFISFFSLLATYEIYKWGVDLPFGILSYVLIIMIASILIGTRFTFILTFVISFIITGVGYFQEINIIAADRYWITEIWGFPELTVMLTIFFIIATVSWLSNREIEKSLKRARRSEADLKKERDSLEITVEERTRELKETQAEKMAQLYRFAEFGRLSSGLFHDLINPLTAVSLNMKRVRGGNLNVDRAVRAAKKMENMVIAVRKQFVREEQNVIFSLGMEIDDAVRMLAHRAQKSKVAVKFSKEKDVEFYGDAVKFNQVVMNLIANAIDSYMLQTGGLREVSVLLRRSGKMAEIIVSDYGSGISKENLRKIFDPFFTTKGHERGTGIGLSIVKRIVEKDFGGSIEVVSKEGKGSKFTVKLPVKMYG
ncbi:MAG: HAMP domain-containing histidine kinase [Candidatus Vogelbacteria bacterium]|nr:HAMP domain-containing histidine kinase [Candidatus Vogelbacteria bacterium]